MVSVRMLPALIVGLAVGAVGTYFAAAPKSGVADAPAGREDPPNRSLDANLYMQTSAEYRAACYQTFHFAFERLKEIIRTRVNDGHQMAIILDLDETIFDNGAFQTRQVQQGLAYDQKLWDAFEEKDGGQVRLVPGAKDFLSSPPRNSASRSFTSAIATRSSATRPSRPSAGWACPCSAATA